MGENKVIRGAHSNMRVWVVVVDVMLVLVVMMVVVDDAWPATGLVVLLREQGGAGQDRTGKNGAGQGSARMQWIGVQPKQRHAQ